MTWPGLFPYMRWHEKDDSSPSHPEDLPGHFKEMKVSITTCLEYHKTLSVTYAHSDVHMWQLLWWQSRGMAGGS
jgi:hypothetical protein